MNASVVGFTMNIVHPVSSTDIKLSKYLFSTIILAALSLIFNGGGVSSCKDCRRVGQSIKSVGHRMDSYFSDFDKNSLSYVTVWLCLHRGWLCCFFYVTVLDVRNVLSLKVCPCSLLQEGT